MEFVTENKAQFEASRAEYPEFSYLDYSWAREGKTLTLSFTFAFSAAEIVTAVDHIELPEEVRDETVRAHEDFIFRIGLIEALSYWKAYCSPTIKIMCGSLSESETAWWKDTWFDGMGEFRYRNGLLDVPKESWVNFIFAEKKKENKLETPHDFSDLSGNMIAFTGGKDSTLVLALMKERGEKGNETFFVKADAPMRDSIKETLGTTDYPETLVDRQIDPRLIALNTEGALNGHTPFSILVALLGMLSASLRNKKYFIVGNEASAEAPTVPGTNINHQYSKSLHFEKRFQALCKELWPEGPQYFSLLRPFSEIGIAALLKKYEIAVPYISSCNAKNKNGLWCGSCAKCLFAFMLFAAEWDVPFAEKLFRKNMFMDSVNMTMLLELTGLAPTRPFECVGTTQESLAILAHIFAKSPNAEAMPLLFEFQSKNPDALLPPEIYKIVACEFHEHSIPNPDVVSFLEDMQDGVCYG